MHHVPCAGTGIRHDGLSRHARRLMSADTTNCNMYGERSMKRQRQLTAFHARNAMPVANIHTRLMAQVWRADRALAPLSQPPPRLQKGGRFFMAPVRWATPAGGPSPTATAIPGRALCALRMVPHRQLALWSKCEALSSCRWPDQCSVLMITLLPRLRYIPPGQLTGTLPSAWSTLARLYRM